MADLPETGMRAVLEDADKFEADAKRVEDAYKRIVAAEAEIAKSSPEAAAAIAQLDKEFQTVEGLEDWAATMEQIAAQTIPEATDAWENMAQIMSLGAIREVTGTMDQIGDSLLGMAKDATFTAARAEELYTVLDNLAVQSGQNAGAMREQVSAIKDLGITTDVAVNLVSQFTRSNLDLSKASQLARLAQDAAVISMEDSSQALAGLLHGILTLQPEMLRYRGIIVDFQSEYKKFADANDRTVLSLSSAEKQSIALNAVLQQGETIAGTYEAAMETASKQMRSFSRYVQELQEDFGNALLPTLTEGVSTAKDLVKAIMGLPEPLKAAIAASGALTGGILKGTSAAVGFGAQIAELAVALKTLATAEQLAALGVLGPAGLMVGLTAIVGVGVVSAIKANEDAHREEATAILASSETYVSYIRQLRDAELQNYALSESLYDMIKATEEAEGATEALAQAQEVLAKQRGIEPLLSIYEKLPGGLELFTNVVRDGSAELDDYLLLLYANTQAMQDLALEHGASAVEARKFAEALGEIVKQEAARREFLRAAEEGREPWQEIADETKAATEALAGYNDGLRMGASQFTKYQEKMIEARMERDRLTEAEKEAASVGEDALSQLTRAEEDADEKREQARADLLSKQASLESQHASKVKDILAQIAETEKELQQDLIEAEEENRKAKLEAERELAKSIEELDRESAEKRADIERELIRKQEDIDREGKEKRADLERDLRRDLEGLERDHLSRMEDLETDYYKRLEDLAEKYGDKLQDINDKFADERKRILEKYELDEGPDIDEQRRNIIQEIRRLEELQREGRRGIDYTADIEKLKKQLEELKQVELDELERRKQEEIDELEKWRDKEQESEDEGYKKAKEAEEKAYEDRRSERLRQHEERIQDLETALVREKEAADRAARQRLEDLERQQAAEQDALRRSHAEKLADLDASLTEEKRKLTEQAEENKGRLQEQLEAERSSYGERQQELRTHYDEQKRQINEAQDEETKKIIDSSDEQTRGLASAYDVQRSDLERHLFGPGGMLEKWQEYKRGVDAALEVHSPSKWTERLGKEMIAGFERADFEAALTGAVTNVQQTVAAPVLSPMQTVSSQSVDNSKTINLDYTGQAQSLASIRSLLALTEAKTGG